MKELVELIAKCKQDAETFQPESIGRTVNTHFAKKLEALLPILTERHRAELLAAEAAALRLAANFVAVNVPYEQGIGSVGILMAKHIRENLIPEAQCALDVHDAEVRYEEACHWYNQCHFISPKTGNTHMAQIMEIWVESRLTELRATVNAARSTSKPGGEEPK